MDEEANALRIIGGKFGGRRLAPVPRQGVRPTADPVREALFNILGRRIEGRLFVDLAAGTGAVGIEAYSRGASPVYLIENDREALKTLLKNIELLSDDDDRLEQVHVVKQDLARWIDSGAALTIGTVGVLFIDPPYDDRRVSGWLSRAMAGFQWGAGSLVVIEHRTKRPPELPSQWSVVWQKRYGDSTLLAVDPLAASSDPN